MKTITIYTNGKSLFTLANFDKTAGTSRANGITKHSEVSQLKSRAMHANGTLHHVFGIGDRKELAGKQLSRKKSYNGFEVC